MISIQTCQSSNRVDFLLRGKFVKGSKRDFLLAAKDSYLELLTGDFKETICVGLCMFYPLALNPQGTTKELFCEPSRLFAFLLESSLIQTGKHQDQFLIADEKLNFRILKFNGSFVETRFLGNFRSSKLKKYVDHSTQKSGEKKDEFFQEYSKHIHVCKLGKVFLVSIENVVFFVKVNESSWIHRKLSDYCRNYDFRVKHISKKRNVSIIYDPMQLRHYIIHRNKNGRKRVKYISSSFSRDSKAHIYEMCMCCPEARSAHGSSKRTGLQIGLQTGRTRGVSPNERGHRRKHPLGSRSKYLIKVNKICIEKYPKKESSCIWFRKNVSFITLLECTTEGYSNVQCGPSCAEQRSISSLSITRCNNLFREGVAFLRNAPNGGLFRNPLGQIKLGKSGHVTSPPQESTSYRGYEANETGMTSSLGSGGVAPTQHTVHCHDEEQPCSEQHIRRQHSSGENPPKKNYYNEFSNCTSLKICFIVNFIQSRSSHADFVRHVLFLSDREESEMRKLMKHLWRTNMFESNDWDVLNKYVKDLSGGEAMMSHSNHLVDPLLKWKKQVYGHTKKSKRGETGRHSFGACPLCQYHFGKMKLLQGDPVFEQIFERNFFCRHGVGDDGNGGTPGTNDAVNSDDLRRVTTLLLGLSTRLKLLLVYFSLFFYSSSKTLSNSSRTVLLSRQNGSPSILCELAMHIYLLNRFLVHIFNNSCDDSGGDDSSANPAVGKLATGDVTKEEGPPASGRVHCDKYVVTHLEEEPNGGNGNNLSACTPNRDRLTNEMLLSICEKLNQLIGEYMTDSSQRSCAGIEAGSATFHSHRLETTEGQATSRIATQQCEVVRRLIMDIQNLQLISSTSLKEFNFNYGKVRDKLLCAKEKLEKRRRKRRGHTHGDWTRKHRMDHKTHVVLITTNDKGRANIIFFKNRRKKKNTTVNNVLIPIGKLYLPMEVEKVEKLMNSSSFVLFAKRGMVFFFHFSTAYGANLTLVNYRLALNTEVFFVDKLRFFRIVKRDGAYEEVEDHILCSDYFVKGLTLKCLRSFPPRLWGKHMGREGEKNGHLGRSPPLQPHSKCSEQTEESHLQRGNNYINSETQFHALRSVPHIDSFYTYSFVYHYEFKLFQEVCASGWGSVSTSARISNCICADMDIAISTIGGLSTLGGSSTYGKNSNVTAQLPRGKTEPPPRGVSPPVVHPTPVSLQISKSAFNEIYKRRKNAFFTDPQADDPNGGITTSSGGAANKRRGIPREKSHKRGRESRCYVNNENDADSMGKAKWEDDALSNALIVSLGSDYPKATHPVGNPFVKRYLSVDLGGKKMYVIILLFDMVASQVFIERSMFEEGSSSKQGQESNYFTKLIASSKGMCCISSVGSTSVKGTSASPSKSNSTIDESRSFVLSLSEEQADELFMIKSCVYRVSNQQQVKYVFKNVRKAYYTFGRIKTVKDYKYKEKAAVSHLPPMQSQSSVTDELKKISNLCKGTAQVRGDMQEDDHILSVKRLKKKLSDGLIILDENRDLHKLTLGHKVLLARQTNQLIAPPIGQANTHTFMIRFNDQLSVLCMTSYLGTSYLYVRSKGDLFKAFQNALSLLSAEKKSSFAEANMLTMSGRVHTRIHPRRNNSSTKSKNQQNGMKKKLTFEKIQEEQLEPLNLTKEKLIYAKCIGQNGRSHYYVLLISTNSITINHYYVDPLSDSAPLQLVGISSWGLTSTPVVHYHYDKGILALSYVTGMVDLFYLDGANSLCLLIDRVICEERIHSICVIPKENKKGVPSNKNANKYKYILLCIGLQRRCRVITYYVNHSCTPHLSKESPWLLNMMDEKANKNVNIYGSFLNARNAQMELPPGKDLPPFHHLHTIQGITKSVNPPEKSTQFVADVYEYTIDTLNDHCTITGMIKLNNFLLIGTNEGVVKAYDIFHSSNAPTSKLFLRHFRVYKNQNRVTKMFDEFLLGNSCVYFVNPLKGHSGCIESPRVVYQKRFRAVAFCESGIFMFVSDRVMQGGTSKLAEGTSRWKNISGSDERGDQSSGLRSGGIVTESTSASAPVHRTPRRGNNYLDELKARVDGYLGNLLNIEKDKMCDLLRDQRIGEGGMPSRNIFVLPLRIFKNGADPKLGGVSPSDAPNKSGQTDSPPSDATNRGSNESCVDRRKDVVPSHPISRKNHESITTNTNHFNYAAINQKLIKVKDEVSANNVVLIKNKDRTFPYLIIVTLNEELYTGLVRKDQLFVEKRSKCKEDGSIDKFVKFDSSSPPCDFYTQNLVLYKEVSRERKQESFTMEGGSNNCVEFRRHHCYGDAKKQDHLSAKCAKTDEPNKTKGVAPEEGERGIGTHCGGNNLCLKMNKEIINTFKSSSLSNVFLINMDRKYVLTELFLICSSTEKGEIIEAIEGGYDRKQEGEHSSGDQNSGDHFSDHLPQPPNELTPRRFPVKLLTNRIDLDGNTNGSANSLCIYTQLYLRDHNLFAWNKHILCLLRNQCVNFANRFYAFLFYNTISRTHQLNQFFQDRWIAKNIAITPASSSKLALGDLTGNGTPRGRDNYHLLDEEKRKELLRNHVNRICDILMALIGKKTQAIISKNLFPNPSDKKGMEGKPNGSSYNDETEDTHEGDERNIRRGDGKGSGTKKKKGSGEHYNCTKKQRKLGNNETVQVDQKDGAIDPSRCVEDSPPKDIDVTADTATNLQEFLKNVEEKEEKYVKHLRRMNVLEEFNPQEGSNGQPSQNRNVATKMLFLSLFNEVESIYKLRLLGEVPTKGGKADNVGTSASANGGDCHLTFLSVHLKGSKYHFSSVTEYYKMVSMKSAKGGDPLETDTPAEYCEKSNDGASGGASPRSGTHGRKNKMHKKEHTQVRRRGIHKMTHHNRRARKGKGKLPVLASRRSASYLLRENVALFVLYRGWLRMACSCAKRFVQMMKMRKGKNETNKCFKDEDTYDCLFLFPNNLRDQYEEVVLCRLKDRVNRMFNFNEGDLFLVLKVYMNYVFLVNYHRRVSFWINIKHVYKNMLVMRLGGGANEGQSNDRAPPSAQKDKTALVFKRIRREDILPMFIKNTTTTPLTYMSRGMKNIKAFQRKYLIFTQKNHIVLLKIVFAKINRKFSSSKNELMERILQNCIYDEKTLPYQTQDGRVVNFSDIFNELLGKQYVIKNRSNGKKGLSDVEYMEILANSRGSLSGATTTRGNNPDGNANPDGSAQRTPSAANPMMKQTDEQYVDLFKSYTFKEQFTHLEKEFLYSLQYEIVEHHRNEENLENINDMDVYENKILIVTKSYVRLYQYDEQKNILTLQCSNTFYNVNNVIMNERYRKALVLRGIFQIINVASKRFLSIYYVFGKCMHYIGHIKLRNKIKLILENKLTHNVMGINMNVNQREHMIDSIRTYEKFFFNFFLVDAKGNFLSIYSCPHAEGKQMQQNYFYDNNRAMQICHDLMLFLQILINGKKNGSSSSHPNGPFMRKIKCAHSKRMRKLQRNYFYNNYFIRSKYRIFLTIFVHRFFIYMNKKIVFLQNAFSQSCTDDMLFELKLRVYNRILKLSSYNFSDRKSAFQLLNDMYDMRANKNAPYFSLQTRLQDYGDIISRELYHMKVHRSTARSADQAVGVYRGCAITNNTQEKPPLERNIARKIEQMNKYRFDPIIDYNGVVKNNIRDNSYYDVDFYHFLDCIQNMDQGTFSKKTKLVEYKNYLKNSFAENSLFQMYFNFLTYMSNNPKMFHHVKKYLHFHPYSTKLLKNRTYYFNMDLLNVIFSFDNEALGELQSVLSLFPTCPTLDEVFTAVALLHMPLGGA
ncbi:Uncharacterized protein PCOAH_00016920 [Plasmodium coatneyi]|uniref:Uncharacterized protein n=1 Tax=Plasmodium coatneyi TaxID=208452 RepID=A0A1B1DXH6_9APIC|nr:Uncharacterized protein PCOAH_00016920 [Plasmodium coatneyi]ANQ07482.1 Uncharacterized protein PCOAH_00016920 [Plasmodium coatneyi]